jgi:hypothetical protein
VTQMRKRKSERLVLVQYLTQKASSRERSDFLSYKITLRLFTPSKT